MLLRCCEVDVDRRRDVADYHQRECAARGTPSDGSASAVRCGISKTSMRPSELGRCGPISGGFEIPPGSALPPAPGSAHRGFIVQPLLVPRRNDAVAARVRDGRSEVLRHWSNSSISRLSAFGSCSRAALHPTNCMSRLPRGCRQSGKRPSAVNGCIVAEPLAKAVRASDAARCRCRRLRSLEPRLTAVTEGSGRASLKLRKG
jgi:hypothetical protein